jgi:hypothetical protein
MNIRNFLRTLVAGCAFAVASHAGATVILQVNSSGILTGATGVKVGGKLYDVTFADGSCSTVFKGCVQSQFAFSTLQDASSAARALLNQVFIDGPAGNFNSIPNRTLGCTYALECDTFVPYGITADAKVLSAFSANTNSTNTVYVGTSSVPVGASLANLSDYNFANFTLESLDTAIPEPSSIALMGLALAGLAFKRRRKA